MTIIPSNSTPVGSKALGVISKRFHKLEPAKILSRGVEMLLYGDETIGEMLAFVHSEWCSTAGEGSELKLRSAPNSLNKMNAIQQYCNQHNLGAAALYQRAFKVALCALVEMKL